MEQTFEYNHVALNVCIDVDDGFSDVLLNGVGSCVREHTLSIGHTHSLRPSL